jgi:HK97 family phage prohead protease
MDILEIKDFTGSVKDVDTKGRVITGYLSSFGNKDHDGDIIVKGAYSKSIAERKNQIFFLNQHNWQQPLTKFNVLQEDEKGLYFESMPLPDTSYANDVMKLYEAGVLKEHSVGFVTVKSDYKKEEETRYIKEIKLYEGSVVTLGANSNTPFTGFKSTMKEVDEEVKTILKAMKAGTFTDETFTLLEIALKQLQLNAIELGKKSLTEPLQGTQPEPIGNIKEVEILQNYLKKWN